MAEEEPFDAFTLITKSQEGDTSLVDKLNKGKEWIQNKQAGILFMNNKKQWHITIE